MVKNILRHIPVPLLSGRNWGWIFLLFILTSCSSKSDIFTLEGRLRNMNQGEFWVYSPDGGIAGIDTIKVRSGRFAYEVPLTDDATFMIIFPNYSEQPVFASPGESVTIKGDATHLKEMIIQGTSDNEDMTTLRMQLNDLTPPDIPDAVSSFVKEHLSSPVSKYLVEHYLIMAQEPDFKQALQLTNMMLAENPEDIKLKTLQKQLKALQGGREGSKLPRFTAKDVNGKKLTEQVLKCSLNVVNTWATWSYQSLGMQRKLQELKKKYDKQLGIVSICLDARPDMCRERMDNDSIKWQNVCDGRMWDTPLLSTFGLFDVPDNVLIDHKGSIIDHHLTLSQLEERINKLLK